MGVAHASVSLFSSAGIGDLGIEYGCGIPVVISAELLEERANLIKANYPHSSVIRGDLRQTKSEVIKIWKEKFLNQRPLLMTLSPPCQGMSTNGAGKIAAEVRKGKRPKEDERNKLLLEGLEVVKALQPEHFLIENVPNMKNTVVTWEKKKTRRLIDLIVPAIGAGYTLHSFVLDFANYGVPHFRKRLITIGKRTQEGSSTMNEHKSPPSWFDAGGMDEHITVRQAIGNRYRTCQKDVLHQMPKMSREHVEWARHIPANSGGTAHMNACSACEHVDAFKIVNCTKCGHSLPRPQRIDLDGVRRAIRGYKTSYRRMLPNQPANTITMSSGVPSSDVKLHFSQPRVLTLLEVMILSSLRNIDNPVMQMKTDYAWEGKYCFESAMEPKDYLLQKNIIRQALGESIPPLGMQRMVKSLLKNWP
jgi:DNA (cytosine-5)-methyltransferase 1